MNLINSVTSLIDLGESTSTITAAITCFILHTTYIQTMPSALAAERFLADLNAEIVGLQIDEAFAQLR